MEQVPPNLASATDKPKRDFRTRRVPLRDRLTPFAKRLGILGVAVAVPAIAADTTIEAFQAEPVEAEIELMPFEQPGESFPGSAFYYLEDTPQLVENEAWDRPVEIIGAGALSSSDDGTSIADLPLAAPSLRIRGSDRDHMRAQECMSQAIYYEAASESDAGQRAVAQVVLNRVAHSAYPRTVCGVVYQGSERRTGCQFSFTCDGALARRPSSTGWARASRIAREALAGIVYAPVGTATHYHTLAINPYWASSLETVGVIGFHIFYRWPGSAGQPSAFNARYSGGEPAAARARAATPNAPDPITPPDLTQFAVPSPAAAQSGLPARQEAESATDQQETNILPQSGDVRSEYANSGRWIERP